MQKGTLTRGAFPVFSDIGLLLRQEQASRKSDNDVFHLIHYYKE